MDGTSLIYILDLVGTASFAFSGALAAMDRRPDAVGMVVLAGATALGGGVVRDATLAQSANMLHHIEYPLVILASVALTFLFPASLKRREGFFRHFDAVGLGIFSAIGATLAVNRGLNPLSVLFVAAITGAGGGVIRDVLLQRMPLVLYRDIYVTAVLLGATCLLLVRWAGGGENLGFLTAMAVTTTVRILAIHRNWSLPRIHL